jgi:hypothetical protein
VLLINNLFINNKMEDTQEISKQEDTPIVKEPSNEGKKPKDPKRVEAGRRLVAWNKERKAKKQLEEINIDNVEESKVESEKSSSTNYATLGLTVGGLAAVGGIVYYFSSKKGSVVPPKQIPPPQESPKDNDIFDF